MIELILRDIIRLGTYGGEKSFHKDVHYFLFKIFII